MRFRLAIGFAVVALLASPGMAQAVRFPSSFPRLGSSQAVMVDGQPASGDSVYLYPDVKLSHRRVVLQPSWVTTTDAHGRFVLRAAFRGVVRHAAPLNGGWVNFNLLVVQDGHHFAVWGFPAHWSHGAWHVMPGAIPSTIHLIRA
jgi:hypothetical protein